MDTAYDRVPYPTGTYSQTHVRRLAAMARLFGVNAPEVRNCRVLEIGCGEGANLMGMAVDLPESQFVGIDLSESVIARANEVAAEAGIENVTFRQVDVTELIGRPGECDYVIAHGVFSWVPRAVQDKILELCERVLAPTGIGYISYSTYPGWHTREIAAEMMRFHAAGIEEPEAAVNEGLGLLQAVARCLGKDNPYAAILVSEVERLAQRNRSATFHDELSPNTKPLLFEEFVRRLRPYSLQFLAEADYTTMVYDDLPAEASSAIDEIRDDPVRREQYIDFFKLRRLRESLICRADLTVLPEASTGAFDVLYFGVPLAPTTEPDYATESPLEFVGQRSMAVTVGQPFVKAAIAVLCDAWPGRLSFDQVLDRAQLRLPAPEPNAKDVLSELLLKMYGAGLMEMDTHPWPYPDQVTEKPQASRLTRMQARRGDRVNSLRHMTVDLDEENASGLLALLDGTADRATLSAKTGIDANTLESYLGKYLKLSLLVG